VSVHRDVKILVTVPVLRDLILVTVPCHRTVNQIKFNKKITSIINYSVLCLLRHDTTSPSRYVLLSFLRSRTDTRVRYVLLSFFVTVTMSRVTSYRSPLQLSLSTQKCGGVIDQGCFVGFLTSISSSIQEPLLAVQLR